MSNIITDHTFVPGPNGGCRHVCGSDPGREWCGAFEDRHAPPGGIPPLNLFDEINIIVRRGLNQVSGDRVAWDSKLALTVTAEILEAVNKEFDKREQEAVIIQEEELGLIIPLVEQEAFADSPVFIPVWLDPDTPSKEDAQMTTRIIYHIPLDMLDSEVAYYGSQDTAMASIDRGVYDKQGRPPFVEVMVPGPTDA